MTLLRLALAVSLGALLAGCPSGGGSSSSSALATPDSFTLDAGGTKYTFKNAKLEWDKGIFDGGRYELTLFGHDPHMNSCVIELRTHTDAPEKLVGERFDNPDYSEADDNPNKEWRNVDFCLNRFEPADGMYYYQGWKMGGTVRAVKDGKVTLDIDSVFLRFKGQEEEQLAGKIGEEVRVTGVMTLPLEDLASKKGEGE